MDVHPAFDTQTVAPDGYKASEGRYLAMKHVTVLGGYDLCMVRECSACEGTGWMKPSFCAANAMGGQLHQDKWYGAGATPPPVQCPDCVRGFCFAVVDITQLLPYLLLQLEVDAKLRQRFLDVVVTATENRIIGAPDAPPV